MERKKAVRRRFVVSSADTSDLSFTSCISLPSNRLLGRERLGPRERLGLPGPARGGKQAVNLAAASGERQCGGTGRY